MTQLEFTYRTRYIWAGNRDKGYVYLIKEVATDGSVVVEVAEDFLNGDEVLPHGYQFYTYRHRLSQ